VTGLKYGVSAGVVLASLLIIHTSELRFHRVPGMRHAVALAEQWSKPEVVLLDDLVPSGVVVSLAQNSNREFVLLRQMLRHQASAKRKAEVARKAIQENGVKYVVITDLAAHDVLRAVVRTDSRFELLGTFPLRTSDADWRTHKMYLYENTETRRVDSMQTPVPEQNGREIFAADETSRLGKSALGN
jgi:hypothetical protein